MTRRNKAFLIDITSQDLDRSKGSDTPRNASIDISSSHGMRETKVMPKNSRDVYTATNCALVPFGYRSEIGKRKTEAKQMASLLKNQINVVAFVIVE